MTKHYKNRQIMKFLTIIGALVGLATLILGFLKIPNYGIVDPILGLDIVLNFIIGLVIVALTFLVAIPFSGFSFTLIKKESFDLLIISSFFDSGKTLVLINIILELNIFLPSFIKLFSRF